MTKKARRVLTDKQVRILRRTPAWSAARREDHMKYYTRYELEYIEQLAESNPEALRKYAVIVLSDGRRWDPDMDVPAIKAAIKEAVWKIAERHNRQRLESKCP